MIKQLIIGLAAVAIFAPAVAGAGVQAEVKGGGADVDVLVADAAPHFGASQAVAEHRAVLDAAGVTADTRGASHWPR